jgi:hypothetical protein
MKFEKKNNCLLNIPYIIRQALSVCINRKIVKNNDTRDDFINKTCSTEATKL